ncbi:MAG: DNA-processing protein DprA, partial [Anaerolineae bacterium]|nr:DNA-processing protein DprA [Anaerolineae bacterium]
MTESRFWLGFSLIPEIGPKRIALLREHFQSLGEAWQAPEGALRHAGLSGLPLANLLKARATIDLDAEMQRIRRVGAHIITQVDDSYPELLLRIADAPPVLYVRGALADMDNVALAIVGTRKPST